MPKSTTPLTPDMCLERTRAGQCDMLTERTALTPVERRLLAIVNGYTPLRDLLALLGEVEVPQAAVMNLLNSGLIRPAASKASLGAGLSSTPSARRIEWFNAD